MAAAGFQAEVGELDLQEGLMQLALEVTVLQEQLVIQDGKACQDEPQGLGMGVQQQQATQCQQQERQEVAGKGSDQTRRPGMPGPIVTDATSQEQVEKPAGGEATLEGREQHLQEQVRQYKRNGCGRP
jgi:hypothetical protein